MIGASKVLILVKGKFIMPCCVKLMCIPVSAGLLLKILLIKMLLQNLLKKYKELILHFKLATFEVSTSYFVAGSTGVGVFCGVGFTVDAREC